jgi:hypothetical protein
MDHGRLTSKGGTKKMKKLLLVGFAVCLAASTAYGATYGYSWEDGPPSTILGYYGTLVGDSNVTGPQTGLDCLVGNFVCPGAYHGERYLHVAESPHSGTPQAYLACISNLQDGDQVTACFWGYDITPGASPSLRIWAHYSDAAICPECPGDYTGSASGNAEYTDGTGWDDVCHTWTFTTTGADDHNSLVIEARLYSTPSTQDPCSTDYYIDSLTVIVPDHAHVLFPDMTGPSATENSTWGGIKSLYR